MANAADFRKRKIKCMQAVYNVYIPADFAHWSHEYPMAFTEPFPLVLDFYYYYSFIIMGLSWIIAPLLFYTILTQSKTLGSFKWLILNYSVWTFWISTYYGLIKPVFLTPAFSFIHIGILQNYGNYYSTFILGVFLISLCGITMGSLCAALLFRYLMVFPSFGKNLFTMKKAIFFMSVAILATCGLLAAGVILLRQISIEEIYQHTQKSDPLLAKYFITDKTFFIIPTENYDILLKITLFLLVCAHVGALLVLAFFGYQMYKYSTILKNRGGYSILISIMVQGCISMVYLITPYTIVFIFFTFQIPNTATLSTLLSSLFCSHCFVDYLSTMYFVTPYRNFILELFKLSKPKNVVVPASTSLL